MAVSLGGVLHNGAMEDRVLALGEVGYDVLRKMARELLARKSGGHLIEATLHELDLRVALPLQGPDADPQQFAERLAAAIDELLDDAVQRAASFRPGHAFCHRCKGAVCEHSQPPSCRHVFVGYGPTGAPRWEDFAQVCLELKHPEVDRLYEDPPALLTLVQQRPELHAGLLDAFSTASYDLMGQLCAGFFSVRAPAEEGRGVVALTFQIAAARPRSGRIALGLNILGRAPSGNELGTLWERHGDLPWRRAVRWAQSALQSFKLPRVEPGDGEPASSEHLDRRVDGILKGLARRLAREGRARGRRTRHAEARHESGARPTRKAMDDTRAAGAEEVLVDERSGTLVVLGDRGRTHFFTREGRLVSSVRYSRDAVERKRKLGFWREASNGEVEELRGKVLD